MKSMVLNSFNHVTADQVKKVGSVRKLLLLSVLAMTPPFALPRSPARWRRLLW